MYTKEKFHETVGILVSAYLNNTLEHGNCTACAVGNLIAAKMNTKPKMFKEYNHGELYHWSNGLRPEWIDVFVTPKPRVKQKVSPLVYETNAEARIQIDLTGYTWQDLAKIESAFEAGNISDRYHYRESKEKDESMFNGLMSVVEVLCEIHGMNEVDKKEAKELFVKV